MRSADGIETSFAALSEQVAGQPCRMRKLAKSRSPARPGRCGRDIADVIRTSFGSVDAERVDSPVQVAPVDLQQARCTQLAREGAARQLRLQELDEGSA